MITRQRLIVGLAVLGAVVAIWIAGLVTVQFLGSGCESGNELRATMRAILKDAQTSPRLEGQPPLTPAQQKQVDAYFDRQYDRLAPKSCPRFIF